MTNRIVAATAVAATGIAAAVVLATASHGGAPRYRPAGETAPARTTATAQGAFLARFRTVRTTASTVPRNGDVNPYGVAVISRSQGRLHAGDILVSNYNDKANLQGTGSTIVEITPGGHRTVFAQVTSAMVPECHGVGLSTALVVLPGGWVVVGSVPSANGQVATAKAGCLIVLDSQGRVNETFVGAGINGPWDATAVTRGSVADLFVTNVLFGTAAGHGKVVHRGTVIRLVLRLSANGAPRLRGATVIATGLAEQGSSTAFVLGPTGVGLGRNGTLYVADTASSTITGIADAVTRRHSAGTGFVLTSGGALNQPLGLTIAAGGDILTVNGGNGKIVETTPRGVQVATRFLDTSGSPAGAGALFGLTLAPHGVYYVDDVANSLRLLR